MAVEPVLNAVKKETPLEETYHVVLGYSRGHVRKPELFERDQDKLARVVGLQYAILRE